MVSKAMIHLELHLFMMVVPTLLTSFQRVLAVAATAIGFATITTGILAVFSTGGTTAANLCALLAGVTFFLRSTFFWPFLLLVGWP
jgi:hypothetical protein